MKRVISWLLDLLYPPKCVICRRLLAAGETEICADCLEALPNFEGPAPQVDGCDVLCVTLFYEGSGAGIFSALQVFRARLLCGYGMGNGWLAQFGTNLRNRLRRYLLFAGEKRKRRSSQRL